ncbi:MAG TPA: PadR family transcriptional regulator [Bacillota bacterium]|nr:PadR family transcriptional regulator [Bacillota bacterium]
MARSQMLKGILDGCILAIIQNKEVYGYKLAEKLASYGFDDLSEGTIYPLLLRMEKQGLLQSTFKKSTSGPRRKYYRLSTEGEQKLLEFTKRWESLSKNVNHVLSHETKGADSDETIEGK